MRRNLFDDLAKAIHRYFDHLTVVHDEDQVEGIRESNLYLKFEELRNAEKKGASLSSFRMNHKTIMIVIG